MSDNDKLQNLLRLKRYENPGEDHTDQVLAQFRERRDHEKAEQAQRVQKFPMQEQAIIPFALWKDKFTTWYEDFGSARWALPVGSAAAAAVALFAFNSRDGMVQETQLMQVTPDQQEIEVKITPPTLQSPSASSSGLVPAKSLPTSP